MLRKLVIHFLGEILELGVVDGEVVVEVGSCFYGISDLLELIESLLVLGSGRILAFSIDPVDCLCQSLHEVNARLFIYVLLKRTIVVNVVLDVIGERLKLIFGSLKVKNSLILIEPLFFKVCEVITNLGGKSV